MFQFPIASPNHLRKICSFTPPTPAATNLPPSGVGEGGQAAQRLGEGAGACGTARAAGIRAKKTQQKPSREVIRGRQQHKKRTRRRLGGFFSILSKSFCSYRPSTAAPTIPASLPSCAIRISVSLTRPPPYCSALTLGISRSSRY